MFGMNNWVTGCYLLTGKIFEEEQVFKVEERSR